MKCPVCGKKNTSMLCTECGFDSSRDYEKYPTFAPIGRVRSVSALREERERKERPVEPIRVYWEPKPEPKPEMPAVLEPEKPEQKPGEETKKAIVTEPEDEEPWFSNWAVRLVYYMALVLMIIGVIVTVYDWVVPEGEQNEQMQLPVETTKPIETMLPLETFLPLVSTEQTETYEICEKNILRVDEMPPNRRYLEDIFYYSRSYPVFGSEYRRDQIKSVSFVNTLEDMPESAWDVSEARNKTVMAWVGSNGALYDLYIGANGDVWAGESCAYLFCGYDNLEQINFNDCFYTSLVRDMSWMFSFCETLEELDLSNFDMSNVQNTLSMFACCPAGADWQHLLK